MKNIKIDWLSDCEYGLQYTDTPVDNIEVFSSYSEAKEKLIKIVRQIRDNFNDDIYELKKKTKEDFGL